MFKKDKIQLILLFILLLLISSYFFKDLKKELEEYYEKLVLILNFSYSNCKSNRLIFYLFSFYSIFRY